MFISINSKIYNTDGQQNIWLIQAKVVVDLLNSFTKSVIWWIRQKI